jgi:hypothetical protein
MFYVSVVIGVKPVSYVGITIIMIIVIAINILILYLLALKKFFFERSFKEVGWFIYQDNDYDKDLTRCDTLFAIFYFCQK